MLKEELDDIEKRLSEDRIYATLPAVCWKLLSHIRALESQAAPGTVVMESRLNCAMQVLLRILRAAGVTKCESVHPVNLITAAETYAEHLETAPGKVVAGEGFKREMRDVIKECASAAFDSMKAGHPESLLDFDGSGITKLLDEVTELPAISDERAHELVEPNCDHTSWDINTHGCGDKVALLELASALIAAATQPQKGSG